MGAVADALGAPFEFLDAVDDPGSTGSFFQLETYKRFGVRNRFKTLDGQWTDDSSMGLCLADSLLARGTYDGSDCRIRFHNWWFRGYNNAFGNLWDVASSLRAMRAGEVPDFSYISPTQDAGNGSLMRLAAVPVLFSRDAVAAARISAASSEATHPGKIAAAACAFHGFAIAKAITQAAGLGSPQSFLDGAVEDFFAAGLPGAEGCSELERLLRSAEPEGTEECWNWRAEKLQVEKTLSARGVTYNGYPCYANYFGSFCLDGLAVALWSFYHTSSFLEAIARCVNFLGDADTTAAICGQLAGAFYGAGAIDKALLDSLHVWDDKDVACRGALLCLRREDIEPSRVAEEVAAQRCDLEAKLAAAQQLRTAALGVDSLACAGAEKLKRTFERWDVSGSGTINRLELGNVVQILNPLFTQEVCDVMFDDIDKDGNGEIDYNEYIAWLYKDS